VHFAKLESAVAQSAPKDRNLGKDSVNPSPLQVIVIHSKITYKLFKKSRSANV
jgi:hypothetical protein